MDSKCNHEGEESIKLLQASEDTIRNLNDQNIESSVDTIINYHCINKYSLKTIVCRLLYSYCVSNLNKYHICINFIKAYNSKENVENDEQKLIEIFCEQLLRLSTSESNYLLEQLIRNKIINANLLKAKNSFYFKHYFEKDDMGEHCFDKIFKKNLKNNPELHNELINEGVNPSGITKIIRNDEIEKLQEIASQTNFNINQKIKISLYEKCSFINQINVSLIDYAAFYGSINCFKFLLLNGSKLDYTFKYAVAGGNFEIITLCKQNGSSFGGSFEAAIKFHKNDIFKYIYKDIYNEDKNYKGLAKMCIENDNYEILLFLENEGMKIDNSDINKSASKGNLFLFKYLTEKYQIPKDSLVFASKSGNYEFVKYIIDKGIVDINAKNNNF